MTNYTTNPLNPGQPAITFKLSPTMEPSAKWLLGYFENQLSNGRRFASGETVQVGWMITQLEEIAEGRLELLEPDFDAIPIKWKRCLDNTLRHLILQQSICQELNVEPDFPSLEHAGVVSPSFMAESDFRMSRDEPSGVDSGWVFCESAYAGSDAEFKSLYEISFAHAIVVPFLALPPGSIVTKTKLMIEVEGANGRKLSSHSNQLLQQLTREPILI